MCEYFTYKFTGPSDFNYIDTQFLNCKRLHGSSNTTSHINNLSSLNVLADEYE